MSELNILFPGKDVELNDGSVVTIKPFKFGQLPKALCLAQSIAGPLISSYREPKTDTALALQVMAEGGEDFLHLMSLGMGKDREYFDQLEADDGVKLASGFLEVNLDFFTQRVLPEIQKSLPRLTELGQPSLSA